MAISTPGNVNVGGYYVPPPAYGRVQLDVYIHYPSGCSYSSPPTSAQQPPFPQNPSTSRKDTDPGHGWAQTHFQIRYFTFHIPQGQSETQFTVSFGVGNLFSCRGKQASGSITPSWQRSESGKVQRGQIKTLRWDFWFLPAPTPPDCTGQYRVRLTIETGGLLSPGTLAGRAFLRQGDNSPDPKNPNQSVDSQTWPPGSGRQNKGDQPNVEQSGGSLVISWPIRSGKCGEKRNVTATAELHRGSLPEGYTIVESSHRATVTIEENVIKIVEFKAQLVFDPPGGDMPGGLGGGARAEQQTQQDPFSWAELQPQSAEGQELVDDPDDAQQLQLEGTTSVGDAGESIDLTAEARIDYWSGGIQEVSSPNDMDTEDKSPPPWLFEDAVLDGSAHFDTSDAIRQANVSGASVLRGFGGGMPGVPGE